MTAAMGPRPPFPPEPPFPQPAPPSPWQPLPRPPVPGPSTATAAVVVDHDWLAERLLDRRIVALAGVLDADAVNRAVAALALLDAAGDEPVQLRLSGVTVDLDAALTLVDAIDLLGVPVHATCLGVTTGPAVAIVAVAGARAAGPHASFVLSEPHSAHGVAPQEVETLAAERARQLRRLQERLAEACDRPVDEVAADMRAGRVLDVAQAREYGLLD